VHGLTSNVVYPLTAWHIEARPTYRGLPQGPPVVFFMNTGFVDTSELCFNHCTFASTEDAAKLIFSNGLQPLTLTFHLPAPHTALPVEAGDWGVFHPNGSHLRSNDPSGVFQYLMIVRDSELVEG
jgi:hypothetical protein